MRIWSEKLAEEGCGVDTPRPNPAPSPGSDPSAPPPSQPRPRPSPQLVHSVKMAKTPTAAKKTAAKVAKVAGDKKKKVKRVSVLCAATP